MRVMLKWFRRLSLKVKIRWYFNFHHKCNLLEKRIECRKLSFRTARVRKIHFSTGRFKEYKIQS